MPEIVVDGRTGVLVRPDDRRELAAAIEQLIRSPALRAQLAAAGEARVRREFDMQGGITFLAERFGLPPTAAPSRAASREARWRPT